eukprot:jgi/Bigna1/88089/estExt_fgenesh1_pg.C_280030
MPSNFMDFLPESRSIFALDPKSLSRLGAHCFELHTMVQSVINGCFRLRLSSTIIALFSLIGPCSASSIQFLPSARAAGRASSYLHPRRHSGGVNPFSPAPAFSVRKALPATARSAAVGKSQFGQLAPRQQPVPPPPPEESKLNLRWLVGKGGAEDPTEEESSGRMEAVAAVTASQASTTRDAEEEREISADAKSPSTLPPKEPSFIVFTPPPSPQETAVMPAPSVVESTSSSLPSSPTETEEEDSKALPPPIFGVPTGREAAIAGKTETLALSSGQSGPALLFFFTATVSSIAQVFQRFTKSHHKVERLLAPAVAILLLALRQSSMMMSFMSSTEPLSRLATGMFHFLIAVSGLAAVRQNAYMLKAVRPNHGSNGGGAEGKVSSA